jgi:predicted acyl esterase
VRDETILFNNLNQLDQPQRLSIGPWTHTMMTHFDFAAEHLRWWDYWLKGIDNGILQEDPVHYYVVGAPEATAWRSARSWPLPAEKRTPFWLGPQRSLDTVAPKDGKEGRDDLKVDDSVAVSPDPRWGLDQVIPEMSAHDAKSLTWTTPPLSWRSTCTRPHGCSRPATASASRSPGPTGRTPARHGSPRRRPSRCGGSRGGCRGWTCR